MLISYWKARIAMAVKFFVEYEDRNATNKFEENEATHPEEIYDINYIRSKECLLPQFRKDDVSRIHELLRESKDSSDKEQCEQFCKAVKDAVTIEVRRTWAWLALYWAIGDGRCAGIYYTPYEPKSNLLTYLISIALLIEEPDQLLGGLYTKRCVIENNTIVLKAKTIQDLSKAISDKEEEEFQDHTEIDDINMGINPYTFLAADTIKEISSIVTRPQIIELGGFIATKHYKF